MGRRKEYDPMQEERQRAIADILQPSLGTSLLSETELSQRIGINKGYLSRVINGHITPSSHVLTLISGALKLSDEQSVFLELLCGRVPSYLTLEERTQLANAILQLESKKET